MSQNKLTSFAPIILSLVIGLVAIICLNAFHESSMYLSFLAILFVSSLAISTITTTIQSNKNIIADRIFSKFFKVKDFPGGSERVCQKPDLSGNDLGPTVDFPYPEKIHAKPCFSLDQYLEVNDFKLIDEIVDTIEWKRFELLCHLILKASGFNSRLTGNGADEGVDIRVVESNDESKSLYLIQCKKWRRNQKVGRPLLQQLRGQMAAEKVDKGGYYVTSSFTIPAREFASSNNIELFDHEKIRNSFNEFSENARKTILKELLTGDYWTPSCASCGEKFKKMKLKNGTIVWGCSNSRKHGWSSLPYYEAAPLKNMH